MVINKILNTLPNECKHFHSAWDSVWEEEKKTNNLMALLKIEEEQIKRNNQETEAFLGGYIPLSFSFYRSTKLLLSSSTDFFKWIRPIYSFTYY